MTFRINDGPFAGQEGDKVQSRVIRDRLFKEAERNIAIKVAESEDKEAFKVSGRGELQLGDPDREHAPRRLRADRFAPQGRVQDGDDGQRLEPIEEVIIDVDDGHTGVVV